MKDYLPLHVEELEARIAPSAFDPTMLNGLPKGVDNPLPGPFVPLTPFDRFPGKLTGDDLRHFEGLPIQDGQA